MPSSTVGCSPAEAPCPLPGPATLQTRDARALGVQLIEDEWGVFGSIARVKERFVLETSDVPARKPTLVLRPSFSLERIPLIVPRHRWEDTGKGARRRCRPKCFGATTSVL
jgi:hypothetical protein